jgi:predicted Zn-dependent peptidase
MSIWILVAAAFPQTRPAPHPQKPAASTPSRPAYMQYLKAYEENPQVTKVVLKNGLTVLINEFKGTPLAAVSTCVKCGYADEPSELPGATAVLEHLIFGKTTTRSAGVMVKDLRALGGVWESRADLDHIMHSITVPSAQWKKALQVEADAVLNPLFEQDEVSHAINAAIRDSQVWLTPPDAFGRISIQPRELIRGAAGYERATAVDALRGLGRERLVEYYRTCYNPARIIIVISGDVTASEILTESVALYSKAAAAPEKAARPPREPAQRSFRYAEIRGNIPKPQAVFGFRTVPSSSGDYPALEVLRAILGLGDGSVLSKRLRDQKKVILRGGADHLARADAGYMTVELEVDPKDLDRAEIAALTEIELLKRQEPDEGDMERALALLEREYWDSLQTVSGRAHRIADFEVLGDWKKMNSHLSRLRQVKAADVVRVAGKYLRLENCSLGEFTPSSQEPRNLTSEKALALFQQLLEPAAGQEMAERERETVPAVEIPKEAPAFKPNELRGAFKTASILRGPDLFIREDHTLPLIHMGFFYPGGKILEKEEVQGITALMLNCMIRGTSDKGVGQRHRQLEIYGGQMAPLVADDYFGMQVSVLSRNVDAALDVLAEIITAPKFDDEVVGRERQGLLETIRRNKEQDPIQAREALESALFKGHPYALSAIGTEKSISALNAGAVRDWYKMLIERRKPIVVIIGDTQGTNLAGFFVRNFSGSRFQEVKLPEGFPPPLSGRIKLEEAGTGSSSTILLAFQAPPAGDEDYFQVAVLASYLGGPGGRLSDPLQAACGPDCGLSVLYDARARGGLVTVSASIPAGSEDKMLALLDGELGKILTEPMIYREYRSAVSQAVGGYEIIAQIRFAQIRSVVGNLLAGRGIETLQDDPAHLQDVKQDDLAEAAQRIIKLEKSVTVRTQSKTPGSN